MYEAIQYIQKDIAPVVNTSSVYKTQSWGKTDLPDYLNQVIMLQTTMPAQTILQKILAIEITLGRRREEKWGSRTVDIDVLFYGDNIINEPGLQVPHPELHKRRFTLEPLNEISPDFKHPVFKKTISELLNTLKDELIVKKIYF
jgi:2-amino-4-hydroxy-6-hydroxymethyldihydropteridine diphosphokinase